MSTDEIERSINIECCLHLGERFGHELVNVGMNINDVLKVLSIRLFTVIIQKNGMLLKLIVHLFFKVVSMCKSKSISYFVY